MIYFFRNINGNIVVVQAINELCGDDISKLKWLFGDAALVESTEIAGWFVGARREMVSPWSTNAVYICANMNIHGISRIEQYEPTTPPKDNIAHSHDPMLQELFENISSDIFAIDRSPEPILHIDDIRAYNRQEALALNDDEIEYLENLQKKLGRLLTDSEIFGFSQVNSEHCRHKIFNGQFVIDGVAKPASLFELIKRTSAENPNRIASAYKDNCAFIDGSPIKRFAPQRGDCPSFFAISAEDTVISLKAETHNFPTTVEPFNGAATGGGGEIRDRVAGGKGANASAGTAVYMTSYPRFPETDRVWVRMMQRKWLYQSPLDILIKASNGASDYGNKFGQPLICGSILT